MMLRHKKGFTLIELLIVISIIGILAVAFLPSLLGGTQEARQVQRVADLQKMQKALVTSYLTGAISSYPAAGATGCIGAANGPDFSPIIPALGGAIPSDPRGAYQSGDIQAVWRYSPYYYCGNGEYFYSVNPNHSTQGVPSGTYAFGLHAKVDDINEANGRCLNAALYGVLTPVLVSDSEQEWCYTIFTSNN